ncbi:BRCA1-associated protein [Trypanosoma conorhini]|uniref:BRCA1-associated protein n=1 Tax=Trypanosoma conorhini TaxID=83891 RepID=A0A3R7L8D1_9TRYP|nr:BRCA1-associated protein [Trypanosoma conorhini]RNF23137.1 BRCA1-associated protein [Trypanosoma conorhini]
MSAVEVSVVEFFDKEKAAAVELFYERAKPTRWLLVHSIPVGVTLLQALQCLAACAAVAPPPAEGGARCSAAEGCLCAVRVGCAPDEGRTYCLLLQFATAGDAARAKGQLLHANLTGHPPTVSEFVCEAASVRRSRLGAGGDEDDDDDVGSSRRPHGAGGEETVKLAELCSVTHGGVVPAAQSQSACAGGSKAWRGLERQGGGRLAHTVSLTPTEDFCTICQETASSKPFIVTLCKHVFHLSCFQKHLEDVGQSCPLCRFSMALLKSECDACGACSDLWTCLVCGWVACGWGHRSDASHHFESTGHSCAMQNSTSRIWNFRAMDFLHHQLAIELGREDDARALQAAAEDTPAPSCFHKGEAGLTATTYRRSRWWWDAEDEAAALDLNAEYVHDYYLRVMQQLMREQSEYFERRGEAGVAALAPTTNETALDAATAKLRRLATAEQRQRRRLVSEYTSVMRRVALHEKMFFQRLVKLEAIRNGRLHEESLLQSQYIQSLHASIEQTRRRIDEASRRGEQQLTQKRAELDSLQAKLDMLLKELH